MEVGSGSYWKLEVGNESYWKLKVENGGWKLEGEVTKSWSWKLEFEIWIVFGIEIIVHS